MQLKKLLAATKHPKAFSFIITFVPACTRQESKNPAMSNGCKMFEQYNIYTDHCTKTTSQLTSSRHRGDSSFDNFDDLLSKKLLI